jgi:SAM-dependent methyltransferase
MDLRTVQYYEGHADDVFIQTSPGDSGVEKYFALAFPPGAEILDVGAGSGRDLDTLIREEYEAYGVEPSRRLRELASENFPRLLGRIYSGVLPGLAADLNRKFDGVLGGQTLKLLSSSDHVPPEHNPGATQNLSASAVSLAMSLVLRDFNGEHLIVRCREAALNRRCPSMIVPSDRARMRTLNPNSRMEAAI